MNDRERDSRTMVSEPAEGYWPPLGGAALVRAPGEAPAKESEIERAVALNERHAVALHGLVDRLEGRLAPVLPIEPPANQHTREGGPDTPGAGTSVRSPIAMRITQANMAMAATAARLERLMGKLAV